MKRLDLTLASPADNLACDEALLNRAEVEGGEILRFWEPLEYFVVVGYANQVETEVNVAACAANHIPIFRRYSGGGTVLQGPGCLNYSLVLQIAERSSLANIPCTNEFIMERHREAIESEARSQEPEARILVCGHTDLAMATPYPHPATPNEPGLGAPASCRRVEVDSAHSETRRLEAGAPRFMVSMRDSRIVETPHEPCRADLPVSRAAQQRRPTQFVVPMGGFATAAAPRKFSGNSQRRHKRALLFHGTFLLNFDLALVGQFLRMPSKQPDYRQSRGHGEFLANLNLSAARIKEALRRIWNADEELDEFPKEAVQKLATDKYSTSGWNYKS